MIPSNSSAPNGQGAIYTLAQNGTANQPKPPVILMGEGSEVTTIDYGKRKCKKKTITNGLVLSMIDLAKSEGNEDMVKSLWNTWHCQNKVYTVDGRLYCGKYCKNRHCTTCLGIRKADMINRYYPILSKWDDAHFVTLTVKAVSKKRLKEVMEACLRGLNRIIDKYEKRASRGTGNKLIGIRTLECCFNPIKRTYNPHLHLIVPDQQTAEILKDEWLLLWKYDRSSSKNWVVPYAQDISKIWNMDTALIEVIKYGTKIFTDPEGSNVKPKGVVKLYARAFYNIIAAMKGIRLFGSFGFRLQHSEKKKAPAQVVSEYDEWEHSPELQNWVNVNSWQTLFDQLPEANLEELLTWGIDSNLE